MMATCPYGHDDASDKGECIDEVLTRVEVLERELERRQSAGDARGARYTGRHLQRALGHLSTRELELYRDPQHTRGAHDDEALPGCPVCDWLMAE